jgi:hypothetical protein
LIFVSRFWFYFIFHSYVLGAGNINKIDGKLWGLFRILYAKSENDLLQYGYDPITLQNVGSLVSSDREAHVIRSIIGIITLLLQSYGTDIERDIDLLQNDLFQPNDIIIATTL